MEQKRNLDIWEYPNHLDDFVAVVFAITRSNHGRVVRNIKEIRDEKFASGRLGPLVVAITPSRFYPIANADLVLLNCCPLPGLRRDQVFPFLRVLIATQTVIDQGGVSIWQPSITGHPVIFGPTTLHKELRLRGHQRNVWNVLKDNQGKIVFSDDIAKEAGCDVSQVRMHIERIRDKFAVCAQKVQLALDDDGFIETLDGGYRLNARITE